eukprot:357854-Chlamydomonas_euryale.AAC.6
MIITLYQRLARHQPPPTSPKQTAATAFRDWEWPKVVRAGCGQQGGTAGRVWAADKSGRHAAAGTAGFCPMGIPRRCWWCTIGN